MENQETNDSINLEIAILESEKRTNTALNLRDYHTVYLIETKVTDPSASTDPCKKHKISSVWRRYTEFEQLVNYLQLTYPYVVLPPLPEKRVLFRWQKISNDIFDPNFIDRRRAGLENFLLRLAAHPLLKCDKHFLEFLEDEDKWRESVKTNGYVQVVENKFKNLTVSIRLKNPNHCFDLYKNYSQLLSTNLNIFLRSRSRIVDKKFTVYKLHTNYGRVFSEWSVIEKMDKMGDALQKTGHYLDSLASFVDASLDDEELIIDQFKEYLFFANALNSVCKHQELLQLELENSEENLAAKNFERMKIQQGKSSLMSRLFGVTENNDENKDMKLNQLDQQIEEGIKTVEKNKNELRDFTEKGREEVEQFQQQKNLDLKDTLSSYALLQLRNAKKDLQTWLHIRECLLNIPS